MSQGYATTISAVQFIGYTSAPAQIANGNAWIGTDNGATVGITANVPTSSTNGVQFTQNGVVGVQFFKSSGPTAAISMVASQTTQGLLISGASSITGNTLQIDATSGGNHILQVGTGATGSVPLIINGVTSQSTDLFDILLTSGGTKAAWVTSAGALNVGANANASTAGDGAFARSASTGEIQFGNGFGGGNGSTLDYGITSAGILTFEAPTTSILNLGGGGAIGGGILGFNAATAYTQIKTSSSSVTGTSVAGTAMFVQNSGGTTFYMGIATSGNMGILGTLSQSSLRSLKKNIVPISKDAITLISETQWVEFNYDAEEGVELERKHLGFIADDTDPYLVGPNHQHGYEPGSVAALACQGIKSIVARLKAANISGF